MMTNNLSGFREIRHTADWALEVWAPDYPQLFARAAEGMYWLMQASLINGPRIERALALEAGDTEDLLVSFLSELLYLGESEGIGFDRFELTIGESNLEATLQGAPLAEIKKEIKAVTYHNLEVRWTGQVFEVTIVFDV